MYALAHNLVRLIMLESSVRQGVVCGRISFMGALRWFISPVEGKLLEELLVNRWCPAHLEPPMLKRLPKRFPFMSKSRRVFYSQLL